MDEFEMTNRYFNYIKIIARVFGMWPFDKNRTKQILQGITYFLYVFGMFVQIARVTREFSFFAAAEQGPYIGITFAAFTKYINAVVYSPRFVKLINSVMADLNLEKEEEERLLTIRRIKISMFFAIFYKVTIYFGCFVFTLLPFMPSIMDIIKPLNESRAHIFVFPAYYFVDEDEYHIYIASYTIFCVYHVAIVFLSADMILIYLVQHACGLLDIAGYRFRHAMDDILPSVKGISSSKTEKYQKLRVSLKSHSRAIEVLNEIESIYAINLFLQVSNATFLMSITLLVITLRGFCIETYPLYGFVPIQFIHLLFLMLQGQFVLDSNDKVYDMTYSALWYHEPARTQALYLLALRKGLTPAVLTAGGLIQLNLDNFAELLKASVSYCMFLKSSQ